HHRLRAREVDVLSAVEARVERLQMPSDSFKRGFSWIQDVSRRIEWPKETGKAKLIFASPPYLQVMKYGKLNWIRLWLLGYEPAAVDGKLFTSSSLPKYLQFMSSAIKQMEQRLS